MALLGIKLPQSLLKKLKCINVPGKKEDSSDFHLTLLVFDNNMPISDISKYIEAVYDAIKNIKPFKITLKNVSCFPKRENNPCAIIIPVECEILQELHKKLKKQFKKNKINFVDNFKEYRPHITLSYAEEEINNFKINKEEFTAENIILWSGDEGLNEEEIFITFPLNDEIKKHSLLKKIDFFYKESQKL